MKLIFIRHGDPDYDLDSLTEKGFEEAALLAPRFASMHADYVFQSPLGRAQATAKPCLELTGKEAVTYPWLQEFRGRCVRPGESKVEICWDWLPQYWTADPADMYDRNHWSDSEVLKGTNVRTEYDYVVESLDRLIAEHGYRREGNLYRAEKANNDTLVFFCHFGITCVFLSHLLGISPYVLWHGTVSAPTSVTTVVTEERREGIASFRMSGFGDISHLYAAGEEPAFAARFCEAYKNADQRHD